MCARVRIAWALMSLFYACRVSAVVSTGTRFPAEKTTVFHALISAGGPYEGGVVPSTQSAGFLGAVFDGLKLNLT